MISLPLEPMLEGGLGAFVVLAGTSQVLSGITAWTTTLGLKEPVVM